MRAPTGIGTHLAPSEQAERKRPLTNDGPGTPCTTGKAKTRARQSNVSAAWSYAAVPCSEQDPADDHHRPPDYGTRSVSADLPWRPSRPLRGMPAQNAQIWKWWVTPLPVVHGPRDGEVGPRSPLRRHSPLRRLSLRGTQRPDRRPQPVGVRSTRLPASTEQASGTPRRLRGEARTGSPGSRRSSGERPSAE